MGRGSPRGRFSSVNQFASPPASNPPGFFGNEAPHTVGLLFGRMRGAAAGAYPAGIVVERAKGHVDCPMLFAVVILGFELRPERIVEAVDHVEHSLVIPVASSSEIPRNRCVISFSLG